MKRIIAFVAALVFMTGAATAEVRTWTSRDGKFTVEAEFSRLADGKVVVLTRDDGKVINVPIDKLSAADRQLVLKLAKEAEPKPSVPTKQPTLHAGEAAVWKALDTPLSLDFVETPLVEAVDFLEVSLRVPVFVDWRALDKRGIDHSTPVSLQANKVKAMDALDRILGPLEATWLNVDDVLFITSVKAAAGHMPFMVFQLQRGVDVDDFFAAVTQQIEPGSWDGVGGPGSMDSYRRAVVVAQTSPRHVKILQQFGASIKPVVPPEDRKAAKPITLAFEETDLGDVVAALKERYKMDLQIDREALHEYGLATDTPVTIRLQDVPAMSALKLMSLTIDRSLALSGRFPNLTLTTREASEAKLVEHAFNARGLVSKRDDYDRLVELITKVIEPNSWDEVGGPGQIKVIADRGLIAVKQTDDAIRQIEKMLALVQLANQ